MDQIFDRFERLIRSWVNSAVDGGAQASEPRTRPGESRRRAASSGDPDLDAAMAELDDFLDLSKTETERREAADARRREEEARRRNDEARRRAGTGQGGYGSYGGDGWHPSGQEQARALAEAYRYLGLPENAPFADVKRAYKKLLLAHHPDRNSQTPEALKAATEHSARINAAYQLIEAWEETRRKAP